jgi:hypothetical protein
MASRSHCLAYFLALTLLVQSAFAAGASDTALSVLNSTDKIKAGPSMLAIAAVVVGVFMCIAGYRLFRAAIFVCGFILGGIGVASAIEYFFKNESWMNTASWIGLFVGGIVVGLIAMSLYTTSIFVAGAAGGVLLAFTIHTTVAYKINQSDPNVVLVILAVVLGVLCGVLALKLEKPVLVIATSLVGAVAVAWGVGYFAGEFPNAADLKHYSSKTIDGDTIISIPSAWWGYLAGIVVLFVLGMYIQFHKTGRDGDYHHVRKAHAVPPSNAQYGDLQTPPAQVNPRYGNPISHV